MSRGGERRATNVSGVSKVTPVPLTRIGVVGAGQLALMMGEEARALGLSLRVLAQHPDDAATAVINDVTLGSPTDVVALRELARLSEVLTFDHELVDLDLLTALEDEGVLLHPSPRALRFAVDKAYQRRTFLGHGLPVPDFLVVETPNDPRVAAFLGDHERVVVKAARGGYDGRGVALADGLAQTEALIVEFLSAGEVVLEERLDLLGEVAQIVARGAGGETAIYPVVTTVQRDGMCAEVRFPSEFDEATRQAATSLSERIGDLVGGVGVMAIEYFVTERGVVINEVALRPHNSGHWTIEGARTSQFAQHLRAVSGMPLGDVESLRECAVMVNVVGGATPGSLADARAVPEVYVHDYHKTWRPGRKLGHVTALDDDPEAARVRAWQSARAYGATNQEAS